MLRFSIRTLLVLTAGIAVLLASTTNRARSQKRGRDWVAGEGGYVILSHKYDPATRSYDHSAELCTPSWLINLLGIDYFDSVDCVVLDNQEVDDLEPMTDLRSLRSLAIIIEIDADLNLAPLAKLRNLEEVYLDYTDISADRLARLRQMLPGVRVDATNHPAPP